MKLCHTKSVVIKGIYCPSEYCHYYPRQGETIEAHIVHASTRHEYLIARNGFWAALGFCDFHAPHR